MIGRISKKVKHQGIGGKTFTVDQQITKTLTNDEVFRQALIDGNIACRNFVDRRVDFTYRFPYKLYYVKIDGLGYIISDDEIDLEPEISDINKNNLGSGSSDTSGNISALISTIATELNKPKVGTNFLVHDFDEIINNSKNKMTNMK